MKQPQNLQGLLKPFHWAWWLTALASGLSNLLMLVPTLYMLQVYDRVLVGRNEMTLLMVSLLMLALLAGMGWVDAWRSRLLVRLGVAMDQSLSPLVFTASMTSAQQGKATEAAQGASDVLTLRQFLTGHGVMAFLDLPWSVVFLAVLFLLHVELGVLALGFVALQLCLALWGHGVAKQRWTTAQQAQAASAQCLSAQLQGSEAAYPMGMEPALNQRWAKQHQAALQANGRATQFSHQLQGWSKWLRYSQQSLSLAAGAWLVIRGEVTVGAMIAANVLMTRTLSPVDQVVSLWRQWLDAKAAYQRLNVLLQVEGSEAIAVAEQEATGALHMRGLCAQTPTGEPILKGLDLDFAVGAITVIAGASGSGKSTLARTLMGLWPWQRGEMSLGGQAMSGLSAALGGDRVGYLPQSVDLFAGTIAQNIARWDAVDSAAVIQAAQAAGLHEWVLAQPQGYDTQIGESGRLLSGGQRQRLGLARALYRQPAWLVLDEPNAHLDDLGEQALYGALRQSRAHGQSAVVISHRPGVLALADHVVVLAQGAVQWQGSASQAKAWLAGAAKVPPSPSVKQG